MKISVGGALDDLDHRIAAVGAGGDVEKDQLVGAFTVVEGGELHRVTGVAKIEKLDALHDAAIGDVEAGNNPPSQRCGVDALSSWRIP